MASLNDLIQDIYTDKDTHSFDGIMTEFEERFPAGTTFMDAMATSTQEDLGLFIYTSFSPSDGHYVFNVSNKYELAFGLLCAMVLNEDDKVFVLRFDKLGNLKGKTPVSADAMRATSVYERVNEDVSCDVEFLLSEFLDEVIDLVNDFYVEGDLYVVAINRPHNENDIIATSLTSVLLNKVSFEDKIDKLCESIKTVLQAKYMFDSKHALSDDALMEIASILSDSISENGTLDDEAMDKLTEFIFKEANLVEQEDEGDDEYTIMF